MNTGLSKTIEHADQHFNRLRVFEELIKSIDSVLLKDIVTAYSTSGFKLVFDPTPVRWILQMMERQPIYRLSIEKDGTVFTYCYDLMEGFDPELNSMYKSVDELPQWVQDRLAVLMLCDHTKPMNEIGNVGRRITEDVFWITREPDGGYAREKS